MVYKYYPSNCYTCDALTKGYFFFNKAAKQNDPYDTSFKLLQSDYLLQNLNYTDRGLSKVEDVMKEYGSCCFSKEKDNKHLWSFYASNYHGLVVGFDEKTFREYGDMFNVRIPYVKVEYRDSPITDEMVVENRESFKLDMPLKEENAENVWIRPHRYADCLGDERLGDVLFTYLCCIKEKTTWSEEQEYRLIAALDIINQKIRLEKKGIKYLDNGYLIPMPQNCIKEIYIGHNFDMSQLYKIERLAKHYGVNQIFQTMAEVPFKIGFKDITKQLNL